MKHGYCYINQTRAKCKCFTSYSGDECEIESMHVRLVKSVQWTSTLICFVSIGVSIILVILNDIWNLLIRTRAKKVKRQKSDNKTKQKIEQFKYYPW
jgi:competence transcription factor ComK